MASFNLGSENLRTQQSMICRCASPAAVSVLLATDDVVQICVVCWSLVQSDEEKPQPSGCPCSKQDTIGMTLFSGERIVLCADCGERVNGSA